MGDGAGKLALACERPLTPNLTSRSIIDAALLAPHVTWGTNPGQVVRLDEAVPDPDSFS